MRRASSCKRNVLPAPNSPITNAKRGCSEALSKSEAALVLQSRVGQTFDGVVTGVAKGNTWVRIFTPPAEGMLLTRQGLRVGQRVRVRLASTNVERGFIDFEHLG